MGAVQAAADESQLLVTTNQGLIRLDVAKLQLRSFLELGDTSGIAITTDGRFAFVGSNGVEGPFGVWKIDLSTDLTTDMIPMTGRVTEIALSSDGRLGYAINRASCASTEECVESNSLSLFDPGSGELLKSVATGEPFPHGPADLLVVEETAFVISTTGAMFELDEATRELKRIRTLAGCCLRFGGVHPSTGDVYLIGSEFVGLIAVVDDLRTGTLLTETSLPQHTPTALTFSPSGAIAYVALSSFGDADGDLSSRALSARQDYIALLDPTTLDTLATIPVLPSPSDIAVAADETAAYTVHAGAPPIVAAVDLSSERVVDTRPLDDTPNVLVRKMRTASEPAYGSSGGGCSMKPGGNEDLSALMLLLAVVLSSSTESRRRTRDARGLRQYRFERGESSHGFTTTRFSQHPLRRAHGSHGAGLA